MKLIDIENALLKLILAPWKRDVDAAKEAILLLYSPYMGQVLTPDEATLVTYRILQILDDLHVNPEMDSIALKAIMQAHRFGLKKSVEGIDMEEPPAVAVSKNSQRAVIGMAERAQEALDRTRENVQQPGAVDTFEDLLGAIAPVTQNPTKMQQALTWSVNNAANSAISKVALTTGETFHWVSERDGCVHCLAYSGEKGTKTGFPKGLTFGKKPLQNKGTLAHPPLHPNCRCEIEIGLSDEYAEALKRESIRSILRGTKMPSESESVRLDAAKRLADMDVEAPASVKKYARDAVKRGSFDPSKKKVTPKKSDDIEGVDFRNMTNAQKLKAVEEMYGKNSKQYREALKRFGKK